QVRRWSVPSPAKALAERGGSPRAVFGIAFEGCGCRAALHVGMIVASLSREPRARTLILRQAQDERVSWTRQTRRTRDTRRRGIPIRRSTSRPGAESADRRDR